MDLSYRFNTKKMEEDFANLDVLFTELRNLPDSEELDEFNKSFYAAFDKVEELCKKYNYNVEQAIGYYKLKAFLAMAEDTVTISRAEYEALQEASFRLAQLDK